MQLPTIIGFGINKFTKGVAVLVDGNIWECAPNYILNANYGCPMCSIGKNEKRVREIVVENIKYESLEPHKLLRFNNKRYHPDLYLTIGGDIVIIEYNGEQHYRPVRFGGMSQENANTKFINQQKRDDELRQYCKLNNIRLLEIPYTWDESKIIEELKLLV